MLPNRQKIVNGLNENFCLFGFACQTKNAQTIVMSNRLREWRDRRGRSLEDVAHAIGISPSYLSRLETGGRNVSLKRLPALAREYGVRESELIDDTAEASVSSPGNGGSRELTAEEAEAIGRATVRYLVERADEELAGRFIDLLLETVRRRDDGAADSIQSLRSEAQVSGALLKVMRRPKMS